jgi:D-arginine dehydrogenase
MNFHNDVLVIGAGMAGVSIAAHLAQHCSVRLLEMEPQPGYHSTGRSAALFAELYGNATVRALTRASRSWLFSPPASFSAEPLVKPRPVLAIARTHQARQLEAFFDSALPSDELTPLSAADTIQLCPVLRPDQLIGAALSPKTADIDVHQLHQSYLRLLKAHKGFINNDARVVAIERRQDCWSVSTDQDSFQVGIIVNAAGAWAGEIGKLAGARDINLQPLRRSACLVDQPTEFQAESWPMVLDIQEQFYFKPESGMLLLSPADETPSIPCDAQPDEMDIAVVIDRVEQATTLVIQRVHRKWAGLRSFVEDRSPVIGYDTDVDNFFWLAALGGYGIQTAPAASRLAASLVLRSGIDDDLLAHGVNASTLSPSRL